MHTNISRDDAAGLLLKYNQDRFHLQHAVTVECVMKRFAEKLGYGGEAEYWGLVGLLHDIDFEKYPEQHCIKAPELLMEIDAGDDLIHSVCSHGYGIMVDIKPEHEMEKVLFAADELTGLIGAAALMRPISSVMRICRALRRRAASAWGDACFSSSQASRVPLNTCARPSCKNSRRVAVCRTKAWSWLTSSTVPGYSPSMRSSARRDGRSR